MPKRLRPAVSKNGVKGWNRTIIARFTGEGFTTKLPTHKRAKGLEPFSLVWKTKAQPLYHTRRITQRRNRTFALSV